VSVIEEKLNDLRIDLTNNISALENLNAGADMQPYLSIIKNEIQDFKERNPKFEEECNSFGHLTDGGDGCTGSDIDVHDVTLSKLEGYRSKYKIEFGDYERIHAMLEFNIRQVMVLQSYINAKESPNLRRTGLKGCRKMKYFYYIHAHPILLKVFCVICAIFSVVLLYTELTNFIKIDISTFSWIVNGHFNFTATFILLFVPLSYMLACTYFGFFSVKLASWYELYKNHSDPVSMIWSGTMLARMIYPMSYNFITLVRAKNTAYSEVLTILEDFTILGRGMNQYFFPVVLVLFFLMNLFNIWSKLFNCLGLNQFSFDKLEAESRIQEGRISVDQRRKELYEMGEIDDVFLRSSMSSDSEPENGMIGQKYSINSGVPGAISPVKKRDKGNDSKKGKVVRTKRNSFQLAVSDSDDGSQTDEEIGKKVINFNGKVKFKSVD